MEIEHIRILKEKISILKVKDWLKKHQLMSKIYSKAVKIRLSRNMPIDDIPAILKTVFNKPYEELEKADHRLEIAIDKYLSSPGIGKDIIYTTSVTIKTSVGK